MSALPLVHTTKRVAAFAGCPSGNFATTSSTVSNFSSFMPRIIQPPLRRVNGGGNILCMQVKEQIEAMMAAQSVSRAELARRLGVKRSNVTSMLSANRRLHLETIERIAAALGCTVTVLLERN